MTVNRPPRVVLLSQYPMALRGMVRVCRRNGYLPAAVICCRAESRRGGRVSSRSTAQAKALVGTVPAGIGVHVVDDIDQVCDLIERLSPDLLLVRGFPWRLPARTLTVAPCGSVNLHPSCLPAYRGPFPVHHAIRNGDRTLGVTAHRMAADFDTGPLMATVRFDVGPDQFGPSIWRSVDIAAEEVLDIAFRRISAGDAGEEQQEEQASYAGAFDAADAVVDWARPAASIHDQVRAWSLGSMEGDGPVADLDGSPVRLLRTSLNETDGFRARCGDAPIWLVDYVPLGAASPREHPETLPRGRR